MRRLFLVGETPASICRRAFETKALRARARSSGPQRAAVSIGFGSLDPRLDFAT
jgi:hypothetical protein